VSEGYYSDGKYVPWTTAHILDAADAEVGPGCCDDSYQELRKIMEVAPKLLAALDACAGWLEWMDDPRCGLGKEHKAFIKQARTAIAEARGQS